MYMFVCKLDFFFGRWRGGGWGLHGHDCMVVRFTSTSASSAYHCLNCEFESHSGEVYLIQHYVIKFVSALQQAGSFLPVLQFLPPIKLTATI